VWSGVTCCVIGIVVLGVGIMSLSWWETAVGVILLVVGALVGFRGGWMYDVHATRATTAEVEEVKEGGTSEGIPPGDMIDDPEVTRTAAALDGQRQRVLTRAANASAPMADLGAGMLLVVAVVLLVAQWAVYPHDATSQSNGLHSTYIAIVAALVGLRLLTDRGAAHPLAVGVGTLAGLVLLILAWAAPHSSTGVAVFETVCAAALVLGSLAGLSWHER
jgi:hypothetical protein